MVQPSQPSSQRGVMPREAIETNRHLAALRALDDPAKLARAIRIVRLGIERGKLAAADVLPAADDGSA